LDDALRLANLYNRVYTSAKPTIAAVNGTAAACGAGLVSVCDLAVCVPAARFGYPEVRRGPVFAQKTDGLSAFIYDRFDLVSLSHIVMGRISTARRLSC
jgi:methylglutaconyl-CoA hydratase